jgi:hypothetical protein
MVMVRGKRLKATEWDCGVFIFSEQIGSLEVLKLSLTVTVPQLCIPFEQYHGE